jgi:hypothetical protein
MGFGIVIVALGYELYGSYALNLAISLKVYDQNVKIALLCDPEAISHLTEEEKKFFDQFIFVRPEDLIVNGKKEYMRFKLLVNKYSPFENTIYLDADNIWLDKKVSWLFGELFGKDFYIGYNAQFDVKKQRTSKQGYTYWCRDENEMAKYHKLKNFIPQTVSGFFFFRKCSFTDLVFDEALKVYDDRNAPCDNFAGSRPDEYCLNVALAKLDYVQPEFHPMYFDKLHGAKEGEEIYKGYWGIAIGGNRVSVRVKDFYNKLVNKYCIMAGLDNPHFHKDKFKNIPERLKS